MNSKRFSSASSSSKAPFLGAPRLVDEHLPGLPAGRADGLVVRDAPQPAEWLIGTPTALAMAPGTHDRLLGGVVSGLGAVDYAERVLEAEVAHFGPVPSIG